MTQALFVFRFVPRDRVKARISSFELQTRSNGVFPFPSLFAVDSDKKIKYAAKCETKRTKVNEILKGLLRIERKP